MTTHHIITEGMTPESVWQHAYGCFPSRSQPQTMRQPITVKIYGPTEVLTVRAVVRCTSGQYLAFYGPEGERMTATCFGETLAHCIRGLK